MNKRAIGILCACICAIVLAGCTTMDQGDKKMRNPTMPSPLEPQAILKFPDIPVPAGFKLDPQESYSFESSGVRVGVLKYRGRADVDQVITFYKEQMPMYNWNVLNIVEFGSRLINLDRDNETCIISLFPQGKNITVTISIGPKSQIGRKSTDRTVK